MPDGEVGERRARYNLSDEADCQEVPRLRYVDVRSAHDIRIAQIQPPCVLAVRALRRPVRQ